jgi:hypothetical protein
LRLEACKARIQLRLNPKEHVVLLNAVNAMSEPSEHDVKAAILIAEGQRALKSEWKRVKRGERVFFVTKWLSLIVFVIGVIVAIAMVWGKIRLVYQP